MVERRTARRAVALVGNAVALVLVGALLLEGDRLFGTERGGSNPADATTASATADAGLLVVAAAGLGGLLREGVTCVLVFGTLAARGVPLARRDEAKDGDGRVDSTSAGPSRRASGASR